MTPSLATSPSMAFSPYLSHMGPGMGLMPELLPSAPLLVPGSPTGLAAMGNGTSAQKHVRTDKLEVCREFQRGNCTRGESDCRYAHPLEAGMVDCSENSVIVCMDYIKGRCSRDKCKYFHPPAHLQARIKAAQHQASQNAIANTGLALPPGVMQPLPKRQILEKSNGAASAVFNHNMFHYQQALANMQLQPAFIPTAEPSELLTSDPVELQCVPMETHFCPIPKMLVAAPVALNSNGVEHSGAATNPADGPSDHHIESAACPSIVRPCAEAPGRNQNQNQARTDIAQRRALRRRRACSESPVLGVEARTWHRELARLLANTGLHGRQLLLARSDHRYERCSRA
ncbi:hypothetical protein F2P81_008063 [Scophthalmus maximus]|uniref:C3H1-type domain-containing protein n=1 Tax=Scophthalmus maximus TaxID=52904 RepID=A0A6A4T699_SCOMX|nr:hypothetical protein F2P81_008063 [Scophthalmus maximus]